MRRSWEGNMKLTIAIPTYNRPDTVLETILKLLSFPNSSKVNILVIDNGSDINIAEYFKDKLPELSNLSIKRFDTNEGFHESFYRLFDECKTEYLMSLSDEDCFDLTYLNEVLEILISDCPNLLIVGTKNKTRFLIKSNRTRIPLYRLKDETSYVSGLIYKTKPVVENLNFFRILSNSEEFAFLYPTVLVAFVLALNGKCLRFKKAGIRIGTIVPTLIRSTRGLAYKLPTERVHQYVSLLGCFYEMKLYYPGFSSRLNILEFYVRLNFFGSIFDAIGRISTEAKSDFVFSSLKTISVFPFRRIFHIFK
jgi:glycosyltransferase involved in cell wall biosynthesis